MIWLIFSKNNWLLHREQTPGKGRNKKASQDNSLAQGGRDRASEKQLPSGYILRLEPTGHVAYLVMDIREVKADFTDFGLCNLKDGEAIQYRQKNIGGPGGHQKFTFGHFKFDTLPRHPS